jgi:hypothetical protein
MYDLTGFSVDQDARRTAEEAAAERATHEAALFAKISPVGKNKPRPVSPSSISSPKHSLLSSTYAGGERLPHNIMTGQPFLENGRAQPSPHIVVPINDCPIPREACRLLFFYHTKKKNIPAT